MRAPELIERGRGGRGQGACYNTGETTLCVALNPVLPTLHFLVFFRELRLACRCCFETEVKGEDIFVLVFEFLVFHMTRTPPKAYIKRSPSSCNTRQATPQKGSVGLYFFNAGYWCRPGWRRGQRFVWFYFVLFHIVLFCSAAAAFLLHFAETREKKRERGGKEGGWGAFVR